MEIGDAALWKKTCNFVEKVLAKNTKNGQFHKNRNRPVPLYGKSTKNIPDINLITSGHRERQIKNSFKGLSQKGKIKIRVLAPFFQP